MGLLVLELLSQLKYSLHHKYQRIVRACVGRPRPVWPHRTEMGHEVHRDRQWEYWQDLYSICGQTGRQPDSDSCLIREYALWYEHGRVAKHVCHARHACHACAHFMVALLFSMRSWNASIVAETEKTSKFPAFVVLQTIFHCWELQILINFLFEMEYWNQTPGLYEI